jgi:hypothetical protein
VQKRSFFVVKVGFCKNRHNRTLLPIIPILSRGFRVCLFVQSCCYPLIQREHYSNHRLLLWSTSHNLP